MGAIKHKFNVQMPYPGSSFWKTSGIKKTLSSPYLTVSLSKHKHLLLVPSSAQHTEVYLTTGGFEFQNISNRQTNYPYICGFYNSISINLYNEKNTLQINTRFFNSKQAVSYSGLPSSNLGVSNFMYLENWYERTNTIFKESSLTCQGKHLKQ
jgi:hypothetical protein